MERRAFLAASGALGVLPLAAARAAQAAEQGGRDYYELRQYHFDTPEQKAGFETFTRDAALPALNRLGIKPVGVFFPREEISPAYVLLVHKSIESVASMQQRLSEDEQLLRDGAAFLEAPADKPAYKRIESSLMVAFAGMPQLETPIATAGRIVQLRIYESPSEKTGLKKIEMFNDAGELEIFRDVGLHPVFFAQSLVGSKLPNLTYMLAFESEDQLKANWKKFGGDPRWQRLRGMDEYADKSILSGITNLVLCPAEYSQI